MSRLTRILVAAALALTALTGYAQIPLQLSTASQAVKFGPFVDSVDGNTEKTALTIANTDIKCSKNGGTLASKNSGGGTHDANGWYTATFDATDTNTAGRLTCYVHVTGALPVFREFMVYPTANYAVLYSTAPGAATGLLIAGSNAATTFTGAAASGATPATAGLTLVGGAASTTGGGVSAPGLLSTGGAGAASTNGAAEGAKYIGGGTTTVTGGAGVAITSTGNLSGLVATGAGTGHGAVLTSGAGATGNGLQVTAASTNGNGLGTTATGSGVDVVATFLRPATAGRTLVVDAAGLADANTVKLGPTGSGTAQTARDVGGALPAAAAGASGGLLISGSNSGTTTLAALTVTGTATISDGLVVARSTSNQPAATFTGNGTGNGVTITSGGGATGTGLAVTSSATNGAAVTLTGSGTGNGATFTSGNGSTGTALALVAASTNGTGLTASGAGTGHGGSFTSGAGATGDGIRATASSTNGSGLRLIGVGSGSGLSGSGGASGIAGTLDTTTLATFFSVNSGTTFGASVAGSVVKELGLGTHNTIRNATAQAGAGTTITLDASASATNSFYNNDLVDILGGTGVGQTKFITGYVGATKVATVDSAWATNPDATSVFNIRGFSAIPGATAPTASQNAQAVWDEALASHTAAGSSGERLGRVPNVAAAANGGLPTVDASNAVKVQSGTGANQISLASGLVSIAAAGITEASYATTAGSFKPLGITRQATAQAYTAGDPSVTLDASAPFATGDLVGATLILCGSTQGYCDSQTIASYSSATKKATLGAAYNTTFSGTLTFYIFGTAAASAGGGGSPSTIADAVWDKPRSGHTTAGTFGEYVPANITTIGGAALDTTLAQLGVNVVNFGGAAGTYTSGQPTVRVSNGTGTGQVSLSSGTVTVGTNNDKTAYTLSAAGINAVLDATLAGHTTGGTVGGALSSASAAGDPWNTPIPGAYAGGTAGNIVGNNLNATVTSRMATFTLPTNFASLAITGGGSVTAGTVSDKTGYSLSQTFPANFSALAIAGGGSVTAGTVSDKTGYALTVTPPTAAAVSAQVLIDQQSIKGTCSSGSTTTCADAALTQAAASQIQDHIVCFDDQWCALITTFNPATDTLTTTKTAPSTRSGHVYTIFPATAQ